jgi:hypothetical protein
MSEETPDISEIATDGIQRLLGAGISYFEDMLNGSEEGEFVTTYQVWDQEGEQHYVMIESNSVDYEKFESSLRESHPNPVCFVGCYSIVWRNDGDPVDALLLRLYDCASPYLVTALQRYEFTNQKYQAIGNPSIVDTELNEQQDPMDALRSFLSQMQEYEESEEDGEESDDSKS